MNITDFFNSVEQHEELEGVSIDKAKGILCVCHSTSGLTTALPVEAIEELDVTWELLLSILVGDREPQVLYHMTRVVGYYSRTENWNKSKIGELKDRQKGNYALSETAGSVV